MPVQQIDSFPVVDGLKLETPSKVSKSLTEVDTPDTLGSDISTNSFSSSSSVSLSSEEQEQAIVHVNETAVEKVSITDHRRKELAGELLPEPLLQDNPGRFVLFPIQNAEVSVISVS